MKIPVTFWHICLCLAVLSTAQNLLAPNLSVIAAEFGYTDARSRDSYMGSYLSLAFSVLSVPAGILMGVMADKESTNRSKALAFGTVLGGLSMLYSGLCGQYPELFTTRLVSGMALATATPLAFSMVGDLFPANDRPNACALVAAALGAGQLGGQLFAGIITPNEKWRISFLCCGVAACLVAALAYGHMLEPKRGANEAATTAVSKGTATSMKTKKRNAIFVPTNMLLFVQALPNSIPWGVLSVYLIDFLSQERGYTVQSATMLTGLFGIGAAVGGIAGAVIGGLLYTRKKKLLPTFMGVATALAAFAMRMLIQSKDNTVTAGVLAALGGGLASVNGANIRTLILNVTEPNSRGSIVSIFNTANSIGRGLGPLILDAVARAYGLQRGAAIAGSLMLWCVCGALMAACSFTLEADEGVLAGVEHHTAV